MYYVHFGHVLSLLYAPMQECIEKYFLQYFTKAFSVLPNKCNTSNWSLMAESQSLKLLLIIESMRSMFEILQSLRYTVHFIFLPKFPTFVLFTLILNMPAIILQTPCCHAVMTSKIPLISRSPLRVSLGTYTIL